MLPSLRGYFGDWTYYACLMPIDEIAARVEYASKIHPNKALSQLIQRSLEDTRAKQIADYLAGTPERFFNSLVLATYGGSPEWLEIGNFRSAKQETLLSKITQTALNSIGFLRLTGKEKIFAIDGQHRLAGIKRAINDGIDFEEDQLPVLLVGHRNDKAGMQRSRRLFTTLNKTAIPVRKRDIIALDEDDVMAITARRLVESNNAFRDPKIAVISSQSVPASNRICLTTIANLYDILKLIFTFKIGKRSDRGLRFNRPPDNELDDYYEFAINYFGTMGDVFPPVADLFNATDPATLTPAHRGPQGGHLLFRPIGLEIVTRAAIEHAKQEHMTLTEALRALDDLPVQLAEYPWRGLLWDDIRGTLLVKGKTVALGLIRHMLDLPVDQLRLVGQYREALGRQRNDTAIQLPGKIV